MPTAQYGARAQITAELIAIHVDEGDNVQVGDLLATMADRDTSASVATTAAELNEAVADLELLKNGLLPQDIAVLEREVDRLQIELEFQISEVARFERLVDEGIQPPEVLDQQNRLKKGAEQRLESAKQSLERGRIGARSEEIAAAEAKVERLRARLKFHETQQQLTEIRTPIAGKVVTPFMKERLGQVAQEGDLICVVEGNELVVEIQADEAAAARVSAGMDAEVRLFGLEGVPIVGKVVSVSHSAWDEAAVRDYAVRSDRELLIRRPDGGTRGGETRFRVYVKLDAPPPGLVSGMTGYGKIRVGEETLWDAVSRPIVRFFRTDVWSWLP